MITYQCYLTQKEMHNHRVIDDVEEMTAEELEEFYGIQIRTDGRVYDPVEKQFYSSLVEWARAMDEQDDEDQYGCWSKMGKKSKYDDGGY